jgi:hypothetical protein
MAKIARILVPLDLGESSARTLDYAKTVAQPFGASLVLSRSSTSRRAVSLT